MEEGLHTRRQVLAAGLLGGALAVTGCSGRADRRPAVGTPTNTNRPSLDLPPPGTTGTVTLADALSRRRSVREFTDRPLTLAQVGQLLWAAQGVTADWGGRTAPSAGALYPLELYAALPDRLLHYLPAGHRAEVWVDGDLRARLASAAPSRAAVAAGAAVFVVTAVPGRTAAKYGSRADRYVTLEAGHATQNLLLQAIALDLGAVPIGAFDDEWVAGTVSLPAGAVPRYLVPVGVPA